MSFPTVDYERRGHVAWVTMNRPEALNAMNDELKRDLKLAWEEVRQDRDVWAVILTGAGGRGFCAGADLRSSRAGEPPVDDPYWLMQTTDSLESGLEVWKPIIAAVNGHAIGIGLTLAMASDFRIASENATFGFPEVRLGMPTVMGAIRAPQVIGMSNALDLLLTGERIDAETALRWGLVRELVPLDRLYERAEDLAARLCRSGPRAVQATKEIAVRGQGLPFGDAFRLGEAIRRLARDAAKNDIQEGLAAYRERREPQFHNH
ncbi:MAG: enoyl-CoA hydratase/isomerase family protein [Dehalococcoidia bacterium]